MGITMRDVQIQPKSQQANAWKAVKNKALNQSLVIVGDDTKKKKTAVDIAQRLQRRLNGGRLKDENINKYAEELREAGFNLESSFKLLANLTIMATHKTSSETVTNWFGITNATGAIQAFANWQGVPVVDNPNNTNLFNILRTTASTELVKQVALVFKYDYSEQRISARDIISCVNHIGITTTHDLAKFAVAAQIQLPEELGLFAHLAKLKEHSDLVEFARLTNVKTPDEFGKFAKNLEIEDPRGLAGFAAAARIRRPEELGLFARIVGVKKHADLVEFARLANVKTPSNLGKFAKNLKIKDPKDLADFANKAGIKQMEDFEFFARNWGASEAKLKEMKFYYLANLWEYAKKWEVTEAVGIGVLAFGMGVKEYEDLATLAYIAEIYQTDEEIEAFAIQALAKMDKRPEESEDTKKFVRYFRDFPRPSLLS